MPINIKSDAINVKNGSQYDTLAALFAGDIDAWLLSHPEYTTTVLDNSLTQQKLSQSLRLEALNNYATPKQFGAVGDGVADDTQPLLDCAEYCYQNNVAMYIPQSTRIKIPEDTIVTAPNFVVAEGKILAANGIEFRGASTVTGYDWSFSRVEGKLRLTGLKDAFVKIGYANILELYADSSISRISSIAYTHFYLGCVDSVIITGVNSGWINENYFYGGRIRKLLFADGGHYAHNNNHFFHSDFESADIEMYNARGNYIHNARFEGTNSFKFHQSAYANTVEKAWLAESYPISSVPSSTTWMDENGGNIYTLSDLPAVKLYEKNLTAYSFNYNVDKAYPLNGKLHCLPFLSGLFVTDLIPIEKAIGVNLRSDKTFFRVTVTCYDSERRQITTQPVKSPFYPDNLRWNSGGYYSVGDIDQKTFVRSIGRRTYNGTDSGVSFIKIHVYSGGGDIDGLYCTITAPQFVNMNPYKPDRLTGTKAPTAGDWEEGTMVYNIDPGKSCMGWYYNNGTWHEVKFS